MTAPPLLPMSLDGWCDPRRTALLVYDMQVGVCRQVQQAPAIIERCGAALEAARRAGMRVAFTRHQSPPRPWLGAAQLRTAMAWQRTSSPEAVQSWFARGSADAGIVPALAPRDDELVVDKFAMSAFEGTPLATAWRDCGLTGIAIAGIALEIGIEPTVRHATDLGLVPIVLTDGCGWGREEAGQRTLATMRFVGEAVLASVADFSLALGRCGA